MALEQRVLNDHFTNKAAPRRKLVRKFRLASQNHFDVTTEEDRERKFLAELEEAVLAMGVLQRLMTMGKRRRRNLSQVLLSLLATEHEMSPRFRSELEEALSERRECRGEGPKPEDEAHCRTEELHEMHSIDDEPKKKPEWQSVLRAPPPQISLFT